MDILDVAAAAHEINHAYCEALGDNSQPPWEEAPEWQKQSAIDGVRLHLKERLGPEASHANWSAQKIADGWAYGPEKSPELKQHPCLVPFDELPPEQQAKAYLFRAVVQALKPYLETDPLNRAVVQELKQYLGPRSMEGAP